MTVRKLVCIVALLSIGAMALPALADDAPAAQVTNPAASDSAAIGGEDTATALEWKDYKVKGYSLSLYSGHFSGRHLPRSARVE